MTNGTEQKSAEVVSQETSLDPWDVAEDAEQTAIQVMTAGAAGALNRSEVEAQLDAAHRYKRSTTSFMRDAISMATISVAVAESCMYSVPRGGKTIVGPSVRLAEIAASAYGNLHVGARVVDVGDTEVTAQGVAWCLEKNVRITMEVRRRITNKEGKRFNDDMIIMTGNAAASLALRNAIFRVVPRAYIDTIFERVRATAVGKAETIIKRRDDILGRLVKMGATNDRVLAALQLKDVGDITLEHLERLIGFGTAIKNGDKTVDEVFPEVKQSGAAGATGSPAGGEQGRRITLGKKAGPATVPPAAATTPAAAQETGEVSIPATKEALAEIDQLLFNTKVTPDALMARYPGVGSLDKLTAAQATDAVDHLSGLDEKGGAPAAEEKPAAEAKTADPKAEQPKFRGGKP